VLTYVRFFESALPEDFLKRNSERQSELRKKRRADEVCLSCGGPRPAQRKYCWTCLGKDKRRKNDRSRELSVSHGAQTRRVSLGRGVFRFRNIKIKMLRLA